MDTYTSRLWTRVSLTCLFFSSLDTVDVCMSETFRAQCWENEVVVMTEALYGRMELGECVKADLGYMGCQKDVLQLTDRSV